MLKIVGEKLIYDLSLIEKIGALRRNPKAQISNLVNYYEVENPWSGEVLRGVRAPGTGFPYVIMLGTMRYVRGKDFCVIYRKNKVLILEFKEEAFKRWIIPSNTANLANLGKIRPKGNLRELEL